MCLAVSDISVQQCRRYLRSLHDTHYHKHRVQLPSRCWNDARRLWSAWCSTISIVTYSIFCRNWCVLAKGTRTAWEMLCTARNWMDRWAFFGSAVRWFLLPYRVVAVAVHHHSPFRRNYLVRPSRKMSSNRRSRWMYDLATTHSTFVDVTFCTCYVASMILTKSELVLLVHSPQLINQ